MIKVAFLFQLIVLSLLPLSSVHSQESHNTNLLSHKYGNDMNVPFNGITMLPFNGEKIVPFNGVKIFQESRNTTITSAVDGNNNNVPFNGSTLSNSITFTYDDTNPGNPLNTIFKCQLDDDPIEIIDLVLPGRQSLIPIYR